MDCDLLVIKGSDTGLRAPLPAGPTLIGRGAAAALRVTSADVSVEHAVVTRKGDDYLLENRSAHGTWLDNKKVAGQERIRPRDTFRLGETDVVVRLEPTAEAAAAIARQRLVIGVVVLLVMGLIAAIVVPAIRGGAERLADWNYAYNHVQPWIDRQAESGNLPLDMPGLFRDAWRLEQADDFAGSQKIWVKLQIMLARIQQQHPLDAGASGNELQQMLSHLGNDPEPTNEQLGAATVQFVNRRLVYSTKRLKDLTKSF